MTRKIKLVSIDGDGCLFAYTKIGSAYQSSWDAVAVAYGLKKLWDERSRKYVGQKNQSDNWAQEDAADLKGRKISDAAPILYPIPYSKGVTDFLAGTKGKIKRGLLSGCLDVVGTRAAKETELDFCFCNILHVDGETFSGTMDYAVPVWHKHLFIPQICERFGIDPSEMCHVGDHENDIECFKAVGLSVAFNPKLESVARSAKYVIHDFADLNQILEIA